MGYNIDNPCTKDCPDRNGECHSSCKKYKRYEFLCKIEREKNLREAQVSYAVRDITLNGVNARNKNTETLKHGRKTR